MRILGLGLCLAAAALWTSTARAGDPTREAFRPLSAAEWVGADGRHRLLYAPQFLPAPDLLLDARKFALEGVDLDLDAVRGRVLFTTEARRMPGVREALRFLDSPLPQVLVRVGIIETVRRSRRQTGGHGLFDRDELAGAPETFFRGVRYDFEPDAWLRSQLTSAEPFEGSSVEFGGSSSATGATSLVLRALVHQGEARFVADPILLCSQGLPAVMESSIDLPETVFSQTNEVITGRFTTEKAGVRLEVTAERIGTDHVVLVVHPWLRQVVPSAPGSSATGIPILAVREATTRIVLRDGETVLVGGLGTLGRIRDRRTLPFLDRLPSLDPLPALGPMDPLLGAGRSENDEVEVLFVASARIVRRGPGPALHMPPGEIERLCRQPTVAAPPRSRVRVR